MSRAAKLEKNTIIGSKALLLTAQKCADMGAEFRRRRLDREVEALETAANEIWSHENVEEKLFDHKKPKKPANVENIKMSMLEVGQSFAMLHC